MPRTATSGLALDVDLQSGVVPISKAASALAALIKRGKERQQPIIVTQKGYPTGVLLPIDLYSTLRDLAQREDAPDVETASMSMSADEEVEEEPADLSNGSAESNGSGQRRGRGGRKAKVV